MTSFQDPVARLVEDVSAALLDHLEGNDKAIRGAAQDAIEVVFKSHNCEEVTQEFRLQNDREWREKLGLLKGENAKLRALLDFQGEPVDGVLDGAYRLFSDRIDQLEAENERLRDGLKALRFPFEAPSGVLRSVAYDILMNGLDGDTAAYQIQRRTRLHMEKTEQLERVLQAATALAEHCKRGVNVGPVSLAPATEAALWINLRNALDATHG